eukprot:CAMPEP_0182855614 /NCGR_PEP_ID=MMETSP0034_2-20130328/1955_1 /TAXON_ID=156128 /ORGANISM="Nephroselmis pyriformis, Strain CCMP717" /LENGTH=34 /DNA_ID= /DNA_START= /DNA_END= /DNA_ORIENTATION=
MPHHASSPASIGMHVAFCPVESASPRISEHFLYG